jgi:hypothetical protein
MMCFQEYAQTVTDGRWCIICWVCGWRVSVLEFDHVSEDMLHRSDSFNSNDFASDGATSSSGDVVIRIPSF